MTISACIPVKNRADNLARCIKSLGQAGIDEICIADFYSDDNPYLLGDCLVDRIEGSFSIGRGKNMAARMATSDILFFLDADMLVDKSVLDMARKVCELGLAYFPIMDMEQQGWGIHSFGQCAITRELWKKCNPWPEWTSYGGEDNVFAYQFGSGIVRDLQPGLVHQFHDHDLREKYYNKPAGHDLKIWERNNNWKERNP